MSDINPVWVGGAAAAVLFGAAIILSPGKSPPPDWGNLFIRAPCVQAEIKDKDAVAENLVAEIKAIEKAKDAKQEPLADLARGALAVVKQEQDDLSSMAHRLNVGQLLLITTDKNGDCWYRAPTDAEGTLGKNGYTNGVPDDPAVLKALCCACATPGPCPMDGPCEGVKCQ